MVSRGYVLAVSMFALGACDTAPPGPAPAASSAPPSTAPSGSVQATLAMADPGGTTPVDTDVRAAQQWVRRVPQSTDKLVELGRAWVKKARQTADPGFYLHARACADLVLEIDPESLLARELEAQVHLNQHQFREASALANAVLEREPESLIALGVQADALYELGQIEEAMKAADKLVQLKPDLASYGRVSFFQWLIGDGGMALRSAKLAIEAGNDPDNPEPQAYALVQAANYFVLQGDYEGADEGYKKARALFTDYPPAMVGRGRVALAKGDARSAVELLRVAFAQSPLADTAWRLGDALTAAGDPEGAREAYDSVVKIGRTSDARTLSLFFSTKNRDLDEALRLAQDEMKVRPGIYTEDALAWALHRKGMHAEAKAASDRANRLKTPDPTLIYHAGAIRIALGDRQAGEELVARALKLSPEFDPTAAAEARALVATPPK